MWLRRAWTYLEHRTRHWLANILIGLASIRAACMWLRGAWGHVGHRIRHWVFNISIGVVIAIGLRFAHDGRIVVAAQNWALDTAMQGSAAVHALHGGDVAPGTLAFIDVDEETWRDSLWGHGEPFRAPRKGLLALIDYAIKSEARYIVLDVIIESGNDTEDNPLIREDKWFADEIRQRAAGLKERHQHILFVRTLREPLEGMQHLVAPELRPSPLDEVIKSYPKQLGAVAPYFRVSRDGVLRAWQMWRVGCRRDPGMGKGHWEILPSMQLAIAALLLSDKQPDAKQRTAERAEFPWNKPPEADACIMDLTSYKQSDIPASTLGRDDARMWDWLPKSRLPHASEVEKPSDATVALTNRIFFRFHYRQELSPVRLIPALAILKNARHSDVAKNGVVVIGQSFEAARDLHATPLGVMPGPMVLINSLESMLNPGLLQEPGWALAFEVTLIVLVGFVLAYLDYVIVVIVILTLFIPLLIFANFFLSLNGIWIDFAVPLLGMYVHKIIAELEAYWQRRRERRLARAATHGHRKGGN
jgi:hypothetical protein